MFNKRKKLGEHPSERSKRKWVKTLFAVSLLTLFCTSFSVSAFIIMNANRLSFSTQDNSLLIEEVESLKSQISEKDKLIEELTLQNQSGVNGNVFSAGQSNGGSSSQGNSSGSGSAGRGGNGGSTGTQTNPGASPTPSPSPSGSPRPSGSPKPSATPSATPSVTPSASPSATPSASPSATPTIAPATSSSPLGFDD
jgi:hypothetical protein